MTWWRNRRRGTDGKAINPAGSKQGRGYRTKSPETTGAQVTARVDALAGDSHEDRGNVTV